MDNYCIRADYIARLGNVSLDTDERVFWTEERIHESGLYQWHVYAYAAQLVRTKNMRTVLDIGCGTARKLMDHIAPLAQVYGIDQARAAEFCRERYGHKDFYSDNFEDPRLTLPVDFDLVICSDVIEHVTDPNVLLRYIKRFCKPSTLVLISTPDRERLRGTKCLRSPKAEHVREWSYTELQEYLVSQSFTVLDHKHMPPVKTEANMLFLRNLLQQAARLRAYRWNQAILCRHTPA